MNYLPLSMLAQFRRVSNFFFLIVTIMQFIDVISPYDPWPGTIPLIIVVAFGMLRELVEDF
jgi:hypothetical protein